MNKKRLKIGLFLDSFFPAIDGVVNVVDNLAKELSYIFLYFDTLSIYKINTIKFTTPKIIPMIASTFPTLISPFTIQYLIFLTSLLIHHC
mgnify:CR=1 FL=1